MRPACSSTFKCRDTAGRLMSNGAAISLTVASPSRAARGWRGGLGQPGRKRFGEGVLGLHLTIVFNYCVKYNAASVRQAVAYGERRVRALGFAKLAARLAQGVFDAAPEELERNTSIVFCKSCNKASASSTMPVPEGSKNTIASRAALS
jgi:hypothetical protein